MRRCMELYTTILSGDGKESHSWVDGLSISSRYSAAIAIVPPSASLALVDTGRSFLGFKNPTHHRLFWIMHIMSRPIDIICKLYSPAI